MQNNKCLDGQKVGENSKALAVLKNKLIKFDVIQPGEEADFDCTNWFAHSGICRDISHLSLEDIYKLNDELENDAAFLDDKGNVFNHHVLINSANNVYIWIDLRSDIVNNMPL